MALTPEDVSNKRFTAVRLREGYDMGEVDQFLDEVEAELTRLVAENDELRAKLEAAQTGAPMPESKQPAKEPEKTKEPEKAAEPEKAPEPEKKAETAPAAAPAEPQVETIQVTTTAEASKAATRLLELAGKNADQLVSEAEAEAQQILEQARSEAERLESESRANAESAEQEARTRAEQLDNEITERRQQLFGDLEREREELDAEVERLKAFEQSYRAELKGYFEKQLDALENRGEPGTLQSTDGSSETNNA